MTNDQEPESFTLALHEAAYDFEPPNHERFHAQAVQRTRQIKRRRSAGGALAGVVAVGVAGALAVTVSGRPAGGAAAASGTPGRTTAATSPGDSPPRPTPSGSSSSFSSPNTGGVTPSEALDAFYGSMPSGSYIYGTQDPEAGVTAPGATNPLVNVLNGDWYVSVDASMRDSAGSGYSLIEVAVTRGQPVRTCAEAEHGSTTDACAWGHLDSGTFVLDQSRHDPADAASAPIWSYYWNSPAGYEAELTIGADSVSHFALTQEQVWGSLTSPVWAPIGENLPAPVCVGGTLSSTYPGVGRTSSGIGKIQAKCSINGELYPLN